MKKTNKKLMTYSLLGLFALALVSAAVLPYLLNRQTIIDAEQTLTGLGIEVETVLCNAGESCLGDIITISSTADRDRTIQVTTTEGDGIEVNYVGKMQFTQKDLNTWIPTTDVEDRYEIEYTITGDNFVVKGIPEGFTLIYYTDPWPATNLMVLTEGVNDVGSLPIALDEGDNYCNIRNSVDNLSNPEAKVCRGAKLWLIPGEGLSVEDVKSKILAWGTNADTFWFETDLIVYTDSTTGEIVVPANSIITFYPQYVLSPMIVEDTYELATEVIALN